MFTSKQSSSSLPSFGALPPPVDQCNSVKPVGRTVYRVTRVHAHLHVCPRVYERD